MWYIKTFNIFLSIAISGTTSGAPNLFAIADCIMFIFMNYSRQWVEDSFIFCIASAILPHTEPSLLPIICLAVFLLQ